MLATARGPADPLDLGHRDHHHRHDPANAGPPDPGPDRRSRRPRAGDPGDRPLLAPRPARPTRCRTDRRRDRALRLVPPRPDPLRSSLRDARRHRAPPRQQRPDHHPPPPQPPRRPPTQPRPARHRAVPRCATTSPPAPTPTAAPPKAKHPARSNAASSATSPATSTDYLEQGPTNHLTIHRSVAGRGVRGPRPTGEHAISPGPVWTDTVDRPRRARRRAREAARASHPPTSPISYRRCSACRPAGSPIRRRSRRSWCSSRPARWPT